MKKSLDTQAPNHLDVAMGLNIRERRRVLGMSQTALATAVGITFQQIQQYDRGSNRISFSRLIEVARTLDCRVADLIGEPHHRHVRKSSDSNILSSETRIKTLVDRIRSQEPADAGMHIDT